MLSFSPLRVTVSLTLLCFLLGCDQPKNTAPQNILGPETTQFVVNPSGSDVTFFPTSPQSVVSGSTQMFAVSPTSPQYIVSAAVGGTCPAGSWNGSIYTTGAVTENCTVIFSETSHSPTVTASWMNMEVSPTLPQSIDYGAAATFVVSANPGYQLTFAVGGSCPAGSWTATNTYVTGAITFNCTVTFAGEPDALFATTAASTSGTASSTFNAAATDASGNLYAVGSINGKGTFSFGNGVTAAGIYSDSTNEDTNAVLVKYNSSGVAQWARPVVSGSNVTNFNSVTVDNEGNIYVGGYIAGTAPYGFGNGVTVAGNYSYPTNSGEDAGSNVVLIKYDSSGNAQWAVTAGASSMAEFMSVTSDAAGNVYASGFIQLSQANANVVDFGNAITLAASSGIDEILVKYNASGVAQWAQMVTSGIGATVFNSIAVDRSGNLYAAGTLGNYSTANFGNGVSATAATDKQVLLVKYNASGIAQWAQTPNTGSLQFDSYSSAAVDNSGNVYVSGTIGGTGGTYNFGNGVSYTPSIGAGGNVILVKYNPSGAAQWMQVVSTEVLDPSRVLLLSSSVSLDANANVYVAGRINDGSVAFADYTSEGSLQWESNVPGMTALTIDPSGNLYGVGQVSGTSQYNFGNGVTAVGGYLLGTTALVVKY